jgi:hypothetical protein
MTNIALIALSLTLVAEVSGQEAAGTGSAAAKPTLSQPTPDANAPAPGAEVPSAAVTAPSVPPATSAATSEAAPGTAEAGPPAGPAATPPVAKPLESEIEVLTEIVDLEAPADPTAAWYGKSFPERLRILALPTARTVRKGGFEFVIDHRASSPIYNKDSSHPFSDMGNNLLGFDSGLSVGLGLRYAALGWLDAGIYRVNSSKFDTYEIDARFGILRQEDQGVDLMVRGGVSWFAVPNRDDALWPFGQVFASRLFLGRLLVVAGVLYHSNSSASTTTRIKYGDEDHKWSVAGAAGIELRLAAPLALDAEVVPCLAGFCAKRPAFSGGLKYLTNRHSFALVCGNTQFLTADGYITNTDTLWSKLVIGFNITREY